MSKRSAKSEPEPDWAILKIEVRAQERKEAWEKHKEAALKLKEQVCTQNLAAYGNSLINENHLKGK